MADIVSKLKTVAFIAGAALLVVACGEKKAEAPSVEVTTTTEAPAADAMAPAADAPAADAMAPAAEAPAADAMAPAAGAADSTTTTTTETTTEPK